MRLSNSYDGWVGLLLSRRNLETKEIREFETGTGIVPHSTEESYRLFGSLLECLPTPEKHDIWNMVVGMGDWSGCVVPHGGVTLSSVIGPTPDARPDAHPGRLLQRILRK